MVRPLYMTQATGAKSPAGCLVIFSCFFFYHTGTSKPFLLCYDGATNLLGIRCGAHRVLGFAQADAGTEHGSTEQTQPPPRLHSPARVLARGEHKQCHDVGCFCLVQSHSTEHGI